MVQTVLGVDWVVVWRCVGKGEEWEGGEGEYAVPG